MVLTTIMDAMNKKGKNTFYIMAGSILLLIGIIGILSSITSGDKIEKQSYRYFSKQYKEIKEPTPAQVSAETVNSTPQSDLTQSEAGFYLFQINSEDQKLMSPAIPDKIEIPAIKLIAPVIVSEFNFTKIEGETFGQWQAPSEFAAGWHPDSATLGEPGNTVINGHHNEFGEVFGKLVDLKEGDLIFVYSKDEKFKFVIANRMILAERFADAETRIENARWLAKSDDVRLTLVTCWPHDSNTHRLILVARPVED